MSTHPLREGCFAVLRPPGEWPPAWDASVGLSRQALEAWFTCAPDDIVVVRMMHDGDAGNYAFIESLTITEGGIVSTECLRVVVPVEDRHDRAGGRGGPAAFARWYMQREEERVALRLERDQLQAQVADLHRRPTIEAHIRAVREAFRNGYRQGCDDGDESGDVDFELQRDISWKHGTVRAALAQCWLDAVEAVDRQDAELPDVIARVSGG